MRGDRTGKKRGDCECGPLKDNHCLSTWRITFLAVPYAHTWARTHTHTGWHVDLWGDTDWIFSGINRDLARCNDIWMSWLAIWWHFTVWPLQPNNNLVAFKRGERGTPSGNDVSHETVSLCEQRRRRHDPFWLKISFPQTSSDKVRPWRAKASEEDKSTRTNMAASCKLR